MNTRRWFRLLIGSVCVLAVSLSPALAQSAAQPNILFVFADDHAYQAISAYGSMINHTPNIDRLAHTGMLFENCLVTNSICAPSRAVILTGKYSHLNGVLDNRIRFDGSQQTFPKLLQKVGYQTAIVGKWHLKTDPTGFDYWEVLPGQGAYYNPDMRIAGGQRRHEGYVTNIITDLVLDWFKNERDPGKPFMVMYQHKAPHRNWMPGPEHLTLYDGIDIWEPPTLFDDYTHRASPSRDQAMEIARHMTDAGDLKLGPLPDAPPDDRDAKRWQSMRDRLTESQRRIWDAVYEPKNQAFREANLTGRDLVRWKYQRYIKDYLRTIAAIDDNLGRVLRYLDETGLADNTVVFYSSDQGFYLGEHGWFDKRWIYEESLRTPLVVRWPGVTKPGSRNNYLVSNLDYAETFLEIAGVDVPSDMQGRSLVPHLKGEVVGDWRETFYYHYYEGGGHGVPRHYGVRGENHTLVYFYETDEWELFDLELDPREIHSVYGDARYSIIEKQLKEELARLRIELEVPEQDPPR